MRKGLCELRKACGLTQMEVADRLQVDQTTVSKWENGEALPRADMLFCIARVYGVKVDDIALTRASRMKGPYNEYGRPNIKKPIEAGSNQ